MADSLKRTLSSGITQYRKWQELRQQPEVRGAERIPDSRLVSYVP